MPVDYKSETESRIGFIRSILKAGGMDKIVFANSGGKDSVLTGILCKLACDDTLGLILPCGTKRNFGEDKTDAERFAAQFKIETRYVDLTPLRDQFLSALGGVVKLNGAAEINVAPRLRMAALYAVSAAEGRMVAGTGNFSEAYMGYFTKWGDTDYDFNPIADLTVTEIFGYLRYFGAPESIYLKPPSGGLYDGQTDEAELGVSYSAIDRYIETGEGDDADVAIIKSYHAKSAHKRTMPAVYQGRRTKYD